MAMANSLIPRLHEENTTSTHLGVVMRLV